MLFCRRTLLDLGGFVNAVAVLSQQLAIFVSVGLTLVILGLGIGTLACAPFAKVTQEPLTTFDTWFLGTCTSVFLIAALGVLGISAIPVGHLLFLFAMTGVLVRLLQSRRRLSFAFSRRPNWLRDWKLAVTATALIALPFLPLVALGPTYWTLTSNDFPLFASWADVWQSSSEEAFLERHPDSWGRETATGARIEKPVAVGALSLLGPFSPGPLPGVQTAAMFFTVTGTYVLLLLSIRRMKGTLPYWAVLTVGIGIIGLYPWARVLHGQWGHVLALWFMAGGLYWSTRPLGKEVPGSRLLSASVGGAIAGLMFGANYELSALLLPTYVVAVAVLTLKTRGRISISEAVAWVGGVALTVSVSAFGAFQVLSIWRAIPSEQIGQVRPAIPPPSPIGVIGLQTSYTSVTPTQNAVLWVLAAFIGITVWWAQRRLTSLADVSVPIVVLISVVAYSIVFAPDDYATGKYISAAIPLVVTFLALWLFRVRSQKLLSAGLVGVSGIAVLISFHWSTSVPLVIPRSLMALESDPRLLGVEALNIDLGNYYENNVAAIVVPNRRVYVVDKEYGGSTKPTAEVSLVRLERAEREGDSEVQPLNDDYGLQFLSP